MPEDPSAPVDQRPPKPRPAPVPDPDSERYWAAAKEGRLLVQRCEICGARQLYPRDRCLVCRGPVEWMEASGRGTVHSFTVIRQNHSRPFRDQIPYVVALVDLEEGPRVMTNVVGCEPEEVHIDMPVRATFETVSETAGIALFRPDP
ncbi:MAG TPA: Zn-ribbon domain-containing OB-fold protein [Acidimicrobiales bacterium]|nr:Zn-ribbon domain-containing OB-fold protein [Acidimicrobiales bacterium]